MFNSNLNSDLSLVAVTGGTGFIGKALVDRLLSEGISVRVLVRELRDHKFDDPKVEYFQADLSDTEGEKLSKFLDGVSVLYHCAAEIHDVDSMRATNVGGLKNLIHAARGKALHWVQLSTVDVYGTHFDGLITEDALISPVNEYELTKSEADTLLIKAAHKHKFTYTILRPSKVYGLGMKNKVLYQLMTLIYRRLFFFVGPSGASANYVHLVDVVGGLIACGTNPAAKNRTYILSDYCTMESFMGAICRGLNKPYPRFRVSASIARKLAKILSITSRSPLTDERINAMIKRVKYSMQAIERELGYKLKVPIECGLVELALEWLTRQKKSNYND